MAAAIYTHWRWPAKARVTLNRDGTALVEAGIARPRHRHLHRHAAGGRRRARAGAGEGDRAAGDTRLPESHASIGSATMANAGASVMLAAKAARDKAIELALTGKEAPFCRCGYRRRASSTTAALALAGKNLNITYAELLARNGLTELVADGNYDPVEEANGTESDLQLRRRVRGSAGRPGSSGWCA